MLLLIKILFLLLSSLRVGLDEPQLIENGLDEYGTLEK